MHARVLLLVCTTLVELGLARERADPGAGLTPVLLGALRSAVVLPVLLGLGWNVLGLHGLPQAVLVMLAALPAGSNAMMFAQRYRALEAEVTAANVLTTLAFVFTAPFWLMALARWP